MVSKRFCLVQWKKPHKLTSCNSFILWNCLSTSLKFSVLFRTTHSFTSVCKGRLLDFIQLWQRHRKQLNSKIWCCSLKLLSMWCCLFPCAVILNIAFSAANFFLVFYSPKAALSYRTEVLLFFPQIYLCNTFILPQYEIFTDRMKEICQERSENFCSDGPGMCFDAKLDWKPLNLSSAARGLWSHWLPESTLETPNHSVCFHEAGHSPYVKVDKMCLCRGFCIWSRACLLLSKGLTPLCTKNARIFSWTLDVIATAWQ